MTFEADNELDWFTKLEFENIFPSVNNLYEQCSDKRANEGERQQSKHSKENRLNLNRMPGKEGPQKYFTYIHLLSS